MLEPNSTFHLLKDAVRINTPNTSQLQPFGLRAGVTLTRPAIDGIKKHAHSPGPERFGALGIARAPDNLNRRSANRSHVRKPRIITDRELRARKNGPERSNRSLRGKILELEIRITAKLSRKRRFAHPADYDPGQTRLGQNPPREVRKIFGRPTPRVRGRSGRKHPIRFAHGRREGLRRSPGFFRLKLHDRRYARIQITLRRHAPKISETEFSRWLRALGQKLHISFRAMTQFFRLPTTRAIQQKTSRVARIADPFSGARAKLNPCRRKRIGKRDPHLKRPERAEFTRGFLHRPKPAHEAGFPHPRKRDDFVHEVLKLHGLRPRRARNDDARPGKSSAQKMKKRVSEYLVSDPIRGPDQNIHGAVPSDSTFLRRATTVPILTFASMRTIKWRSSSVSQMKLSPFFSITP